MIRSAWRGLTALPWLLAAAGASAAESPTSVPMRFQGEWASSLKACGTTADESRLTIGADRIRFYESGGAIKAVVTQGDDVIAMIIELSGEGESWLSFRHFQLSADQKTLTDVTDESQLVRYRCPKAGK